ncbi:MAG: hypothetical protein AAF705_07465 [Bacteroidota bacterium]
MHSLKAIFQFTLSDQQYDRTIRYLGHLTFLTLGILSLIYYKERMLHFDSASYAFNMIFRGEFNTAHGRYISYIPQVLALGLRNWGASLQTVLMAYSASFILLYYLIFYVIVYGFKNTKGGLLLALACTLMVRYKFYAPVGEVILGIPFVILVLAWLMSKPYQAEGRRILKVGLAISLSSFLLITHPFPMVTLGFVWLIWMVYSKRWRIAYEWILPFSWLLTWGIKLGSQGLGTSYETGRIDQFLEAKKVLSNLDEYYVWSRLGWYLDVHYLVPMILFLAVLIYLFVQKKIWTALSSMLAFVVITAMTIVLFSYLGGPIYVLLDGYLAHLGVIMGLVFVLSIGHRREWWLAGIFVFLLIFSVDRIKGTHNFFTQREDLLLAIMESHTDPGQNKLVTSMDAFDWERLWLPWAVGIETLMMSTLSTPDDPKTLYFYENKANIEDLLDDPALFLALQYFFNPYEVDQLPVQFPAKIPAGKYKEIDLKGKY